MKLTVSDVKDKIYKARELLDDLERSLGKFGKENWKTESLIKSHNLVQLLEVSLKETFYELEEQYCPKKHEDCMDAYDDNCDCHDECACRNP